ncbi:DUF1801 domain-containing protein [Lacinutrix neustonica]|uniref:DUF1801 domain-containing protein n=1 Tax=Lacinutrix neustonica TaxID=2980107 RepID=A0A9E8SGR2_9FLAO|nr:DUF1801 domain-containing protein [Lacinutrix neustonica]WAC01985.1 DUF1801 domain-containing protein [Lacinutrix neustonica]
MKKVYSVEEYIETNAHFEDALLTLRHLIHTTELQETIKWSAPVYTIKDKNVIGLGAFKNHFGIWFFNGVFLKDNHNLLVNAQDGKTKALRQMRFESLEEIDKDLVLAYIKEAIENQKLGKEIKPVRNVKKALCIPNELQNLLDNASAFRLAYEKLTPGKQREYCEYIIEAKREATKQSRLEKIIPMIVAGVGLHDKYK